MLQSKKIISDEEIEELRTSVNEDGERMKGIFSLIGTYATLFGESVAGDLLLPMVIADFRKLNSDLLFLLNMNKKLAGLMAKEKLPMIPLDDLRADFVYAFGESMDDALPNFSKHISSA